MVAVIDYDAGNIKSVEKACAYLGQDVRVTRDKEDILTADHVILPGVGAFGDAMAKLRGFGLEGVIRRVAEQGTPLLGICLGLQLMFESSEESPGERGLALLPGKILRIPDAAGMKVPHIGWNCLTFPEKRGRLFAGVPEAAYVYFVHSYYLKADEEEDVAASTEYGVRIHAAVERGNLFACQFHPEKSSGVGLAVLRNFIACGKAGG